MHSCDVAIIGGGPGGACLAGLLALRGHQVTLLERQAFPRFMVGESLLPQSCGVFEELELLPELDARFMRKNGATFACATSGRVRHITFADAFDKRYDHAFQVRRGVFDELLLNRARELGVEVMQPCKVKKVRFEDGRAVGLQTISEEHGERDISARFVADASGRAAVIASATGGRIRIAGLDQSSVFAHYRQVQRQPGERAGNVEILMVPNGWLWVIPFKDGVSSVGAVMPRRWVREQRSRGLSERQLLNAAIAMSPWASGVMQGAEPVGETRMTGDFSYTCSQLHGPGWLALGDAAGFVDPLFSSGVHLAIGAAQIARDAIDTCLRQPEESDTALHQYNDILTRAGKLFLGAVQATYHGRLRELIFFGEQRPVVHRMMTSMLAGDVFHPSDDLPSWVRFMSTMYDGGIDKLANALQAQRAGG